LPRTRPCSKQLQLGRLRKADQFLAAAKMIEDLSDDDDDIGDAFVTLCVHAGIAAADVVCCSILGEHAQGENHAEAVALLARADTSLASRLRVLLAMKTDAGYSHVPMSATDRKKAERAAALLVVAAHSA
jgi:hypothetical protein